MRKGKRALLAVLSLLLLLVLGVLIFRAARSAKARQLYQAGEYTRAMSLYRELGDETNAARCELALAEARYLEAEELLEQGAYEEAEAAFAALGDYRDSRALVDTCRFRFAGELTARGEPERARELYLALGEYPGCAEALEGLVPSLYDRAMDLAGDFKLEQACAIWEQLGAYRESQTLLKRGQRALGRLRDGYRTKLGELMIPYESKGFPGVYESELAYVLIPEKPDRDTRFFLYFPGGRDEELYVDYFIAYMQNPAPNTLAVFLKRNGVPAMERSCARAINFLEELATDYSLFPHEILVAGSSLGAYPAIQCPRIAWRDFGIRIPSVLSLDAGNGWNESDLVPSRKQCEELAKIGTHFYLFQAPWIGTEYEPIRYLVDCGCPVTRMGCLRDDHETITMDVLGRGMVDWALQGCPQPCPLDIYEISDLKPNT